MRKGGGQGDEELTSLSGLRLELQGSVELADDEFDDGEAEARSSFLPGSRFIEPDEAVEDPFLIIRGDAGALITDDQLRASGDGPGF